MCILPEGTHFIPQQFFNYRQRQGPRDFTNPVKTVATPEAWRREICFGRSKRHKLVNHHCLLIQLPIVLMVQSLYVWWFTGNLSGCHEKSPCSVDVDLLSTAMFNCQRVDPDWKLLNGSVWKMRNPYIHPLVIFIMFPFKWLFGRYTRIPHVQTHPFEASNVFFGIRVDKDG